jgi:hypothetical protein
LVPFPKPDIGSAARAVALFGLAGAIVGWVVVRVAYGKENAR